MFTSQKLISNDLRILLVNFKRNILTKRYKFTVAKTVDINIVNEHKYDASGLHSKHYTIKIHL